MTTPAATVPARRGWLRQLGIDTAFIVAGFPLAIVAFVLVVTGLSLGLGLLAVFLVGIPVLVAMLYLARGLAEVERARLAPVLRRPRVAVRYRPAPPGAGWVRRLTTPMADVQYWLDALHGIVRFPIAVAGFSVIVIWWTSALGGISYGLWDWTLPHDVRDQGLIVANDRGLPDVLGIDNTATNRILVYAVIGVFFSLTLPFVVRLWALLEAWVAHGMLNGVARLREDVATSHAQTVAAVSAEATALRRLERDLHDGPQQRLVRLAVDLGRARHQLETDPAVAAATVDEALVQAREALDELRTLSRGIAPPVLTDRGLAAAVAALAARATVPVTLSLPEVRLDPLAEQTAYFTIAEALANIAKHSGAAAAAVSASLADGRLVVTVTDDGRGGAHLAKGHGLAGLDDRVRAAGGTFAVTSPPGGPTTVRATLPAQAVPNP